MDNEIHREIGRHDGLILSLQKDMQEVKADVKLIVAAISESKGGIKVIMIVAGVAGSCGALLAKLLPYLWALPR